MSAAARYEDTVSYDPDPVEEPLDERFDPNSGRLWSEIAAQAREARRIATVEKASLYMAAA